MPVEPGQTLDVIAQDEAEQRRCIEMAASQPAAGPGRPAPAAGQRLPAALQARRWGPAPGTLRPPLQHLPQLPPHRISLHPLAMA